MSTFGIYILTYNKDHHLAEALIASIRYFHPAIPIMIIPGERFDWKHHRFQEQIMTTPSGFWRKMGHGDRKFWAFQGPFEKFLYMDADVLCLHDLSRVIHFVNQQTGPFVLAPTISNEEWANILSHSSETDYQKQIEFVRQQTGNLDNIKLFDPNYDPLVLFPFNNGVFASSAGTFKEQDFAGLYERESAFYRERLGKMYSWSGSDVFFIDQGRLHYLLATLQIPVVPIRPYADYASGMSNIQIRLEEVLENRFQYHYIHWCGSLRPSPSSFCTQPLLKFYAITSPMQKLLPRSPEIPGTTVWRYFYVQAGNSISTMEKVRWSFFDFYKTTRAYLGRIKRGLQYAFRLKIDSKIPI